MTARRRVYPMRLAELRRDLASFGLARTMADVALRAVNKVVLLHLVKAIALERADPRLLADGGDDDAVGYRFVKLDEETLQRFVHLPHYELTGEFLREAFARGDDCYGFMRGDELAAFSWYTRLPTPVGLPGVALRFGGGWVHIYKGLTHPAHRGRRLHGRGLAKGLEVQRTRGAKGLVSYVDLTSFGARRSVARAGFTEFGTAVIVRLFGRYLVWHSPACRRRQFQLEVGRPGAGSGVARPARSSPDSNKQTGGRP